MAKIDSNVNYYSLLGVDSSANDKQIREAYKKEGVFWLRVQNLVGTLLTVSSFSFEMPPRPES